jgi:hypothetical protein
MALPGAFTVEFKTATGTGVTFGITDKSTKILFADGTNIVDTGTVSLTGVQTLTNKTLTSPTINDPIIMKLMILMVMKKLYLQLLLLQLMKLQSLMLQLVIALIYR